MRLSSAQLAQYERDGFLVLENSVKASACDAVRARAEELVRDFDPQGVVSVFSTLGAAAVLTRALHTFLTAFSVWLTEPRNDRPCESTPDCGPFRTTDNTGTRHQRLPATI
jgi:Phytanoyl-CoA dioxygenase (PhyH)